MKVGKIKKIQMEYSYQNQVQSNPNGNTYSDWILFQIGWLWFRFIKKSDLGIGLGLNLKVCLDQKNRIIRNFIRPSIRLVFLEKNLDL